jgi:hypothetical protein
MEKYIPSDLMVVHFSIDLGITILRISHVFCGSTRRLPSLRAPGHCARGHPTHAPEVPCGAVARRETNRWFETVNMGRYQGFKMIYPWLFNIAMENGHL